MTYFILLLAALGLELVLNLPVGSLPLALEQEGATREQIALAMGTGMFSALFVSIPIGALVDRIGRLATMGWALLLAFITMACLASTHGPIWAACLMACRAIAICAFMTAEFAYGSVLVSKEKSVSAVATMGIVGNFCFAFAPAFAVYLWQKGCGREQYWLAEVFIVTSALLLTKLPRKHDVKITSRSKRKILLRKTWAPTIIFAISCALAGGVNGSLAVLTFHDRGIANGATIFTASAVTTVLFRYPASRLVEIYGARKIAIPTALLQVIGCLLASRANTLLPVLLAGFCLGTTWSAIVPVSLALLFEHSSTRTRGAAMGAYNFSLGAGAAAGAAIATISTIMGQGYAAAITICALAPLGTLPFLLLAPAKKQRTFPEANINATIRSS